MAQASWVQVSSERFALMQVGKRYRIDGRLGKCIAKDEGSNKLASGFTSSLPMVKIEWRE